MNKYARHKLEIRVESQPERCEICHKSDQFDKEKNYCSRCDGIITMISTTRPRARIFNIPEILVENQGAHLTLTKRWFSLPSLLLILFAGVWNAASIGQFIDAVRNFGLMSALGGSWFSLLIGIAFAYFALALVLNRSTIKVTGGEISVRHGPFPWLGNRTINVADLDQIFCETVQTRRYTFLYQVCADMRNGRRVPLIGDFCTQEPAIFIEQQIEARLGIIDKPVPGELPRL